MLGWQSDRLRRSYHRPDHRVFFGLSLHGRSYQARMKRCSSHSQVRPSVERAASWLENLLQIEELLGTTHTDVLVAFAWLVPVAVRGACILRLIVPRTAAHSTALTDPLHPFRSDGQRNFLDCAATLRAACLIPLMLLRHTRIAQNSTASIVQLSDCIS